MFHTVALSMALVFGGVAGSGLQDYGNQRFLLLMKAQSCRREPPRGICPPLLSLNSTSKTPGELLDHSANWRGRASDGTSPHRPLHLSVMSKIVAPKDVTLSGCDSTDSELQCLHHSATGLAA